MSSIVRSRIRKYPARRQWRRKIASPSCSSQAARVASLSSCRQLIRIRLLAYRHINWDQQNLPMEGKTWSHRSNWTIRRTHSNSSWIRCWSRTNKQQREWEIQTSRAVMVLHPSRACIGGPIIAHLIGIQNRPSAESSSSQTRHLFQIQICLPQRAKTNTTLWIRSTNFRVTKRCIHSSRRWKLQQQGAVLDTIFMYLEQVQSLRHILPSLQAWHAANQLRKNLRTWNKRPIVRGLIIMIGMQWSITQ